MTDVIRAPWTSEQVQALNDFQEHGHFHPFMCGGEHTLGRSPALDATHNGWICPDSACTYTQDWAWATMARPAAGVRDAARQANGQQPAAGPVTLATPCDNCDHALNWHTGNAACIFAFCGCGRFRAPVADERAVGGQDATQPTTDETEARVRAAALQDAIRIVLNRVRAYEGMSQEAVSLNRERSAIVDELRRLAAGAES